MPKRGRQNDSFKDFVLDQLADLRGVTCRAMFGGYGLYRGTVFFGIIHRGRVYFKTTQESRQKYVSRKMKPFHPNQKQTLTSYYEVPPEVIDDRETLASWAGEAAGR